jgi:hypothetical protein
MRKSNYSFTIDGNELKIVDEWYGNFMSVTNNFENVLTEIREVIGESIVGMDIIYRDTEGIWDRVTADWNGEECVNVNF